MSDALSRGGRALGRRGAETRARLLDAVARHLASTPWHRASVPALIRDWGAGVSATAFYQYFPDLPSAVRELAWRADAPEHARRIVALLDWEAAHGAD